MESGYNISNRKRFAKITGGSMNNSMKKNIRHFFLLTALAAGTIHLVNRFIDMQDSVPAMGDTDTNAAFKNRVPAGRADGMVIVASRLRMTIAMASPHVNFSRKSAV